MSNEDGDDFGGITLFGHQLEATEKESISYKLDDKQSKKILKRLERSRLLVSLRLEEGFNASLPLLALSTPPEPMVVQKEKAKAKPTIKAYYKEIGSVFYGPRATLTPRRGRGPRPNRRRAARSAKRTESAALKDMVL